MHITCRAREFQQHGQLPSALTASVRMRLNGSLMASEGELIWQEGGKGMDLKGLYLPHPCNLVVIYYLNIQLYNDPHSVYRAT